jgi:hypothetical protein
MISTMLRIRLRGSVTEAASTARAMLLVVVFGIGLAAGCSGPPPPKDDAAFHADNWPLAVEYGFAVAPTWAVPDISDPDEASALFTNALYDGMMSALPGTPLVAPHEALQKLKAGDSNAFARINSLGRQLYRGEDPGPGQLGAISRDLEHRFVMVSWFEETATKGIEGVQMITHPAGHTETTDHGLAYHHIEGQATGIVIDLGTGEVLWRAVANYDTDRLYVADGAVQTELDLTRAAAATRLGNLLTQD